MLHVHVDNRLHTTKDLLWQQFDGYGLISLLHVNAEHVSLLQTVHVQTHVLPGPTETPLPRDLQHPCLLYTSPSPRDATLSRMPSSA